MTMSNQEGSLGIPHYIQEDINVIVSTPNTVKVPDIQDIVQILLDCKEKGKSFYNQLPPSIHLVPNKLRDHSPHSFTPQAVSIGPLHREDKNVQEFEDRKATYLHLLLDRLHVPPEQTLESCLLKVTASIDRIRACYGYSGTKSYTDVELAKMMVMDACFIIEFICPSVTVRDSVLKNVSLKLTIFHDLLLLENQIPFFVLQDIFNCTMNSKRTLPSIILKRLKFLNPFQVMRTDVDDATPDHILGLLQRSFHPPIDIISPTPSSNPRNKQSIMELDKAGVKFKPNKDRDWELDMKFISSRFACICHCWGNPTLKMPNLHIRDSTELILRNIIAYEQCIHGVPFYITSFVSAMDILVNTADDIFKLVESKVIVNSLGSNEEAASMINGLCQDVVTGSFYYGEQWQQLDAYSNSYWPKHIAWLKRTYFNSPWNIIALIAALILFTLTMIQTIFTINPA